MSSHSESWTKRLAIVRAAGILAEESLMGVADATDNMMTGGGSTTSRASN